MRRTQLNYLIEYAFPHRWVLGSSALFMAGQSVAALAVPWLAGRLTAALIGPTPASTESLAVFVVLFLGLFGGQALLTFGGGYLVARVGADIAAALRARVYDHLQALPLPYHHRRSRGDLLALLARDVEILSGFLSGAVVRLVPIGLTFIGATVLMLRIDPVLGALALVLVPLFYVVVKLLGRRIRPLSQGLAHEHASALALANENLGMLPIIKAFTREARESGRYRDRLRRIVSLTRRQLWIQSALSPLIQFLAAAGIILVLWLASQKVLTGGLAAGEMVSFLLYGLLLARPTSALAAMYGQIQHARAAVDRLLSTLREPLEPLQHHLPAMPAVHGELVFENVSFAYPEREPALQNVDLHIAAGETVALVGPNGAGKSTLAHLLMRFYLPDEGEIRIDGVDIGKVSLESLRRQIGLVPQRVLLFNGTVRDNIAYGAATPSGPEVEAAARAARAHDFVIELPDGYDTVIGEEGVRLSGGQQQRLALARALLKNPPIMILDEATAMFDPAGEMEFLRECEQAFKRRTVIIISHRRASLAVADRIIELNNGRIVSEKPKGFSREIAVTS